MHEFQIRPHFATTSGPKTKAKPAQRPVQGENTQSPMERSCQHSYERVVEPLLTVNRYREDYAPRSVAYTQGCAMNHKLPARPPTQKQHLVSTWDS
jgi:hypothetical protein